MNDPGAGEFIIIAAAFVLGLGFTWKLIEAVWSHADRQRKMVDLLEQIRDRLAK